MKTFKEFLTENTLYDQQTKAQFVSSEEAVATAFLFNFLGMLGLYNVVINQTTIKNFLKTDKKLQVGNINDDNLDFSLSLKLAHNLGFFKSQSVVNEMTRFMVLLKNGSIDNINSSIVHEWLSKMNIPKYKMSLPTKLRPVFEQFIDGKQPRTVEWLAVMLRRRSKKYKEGGDFEKYARILTFKKVYPSLVNATSTQPVSQQITNVVTTTTKSTDTQTKTQDIKKDSVVKPAIDKSTKPVVDKPKIDMSIDSSLMIRNFRKGLEDLDYNYTKYYLSSFQANPKLNFSVDYFSFHRNDSNDGSFNLKLIDMDYLVSEIYFKNLLSDDFENIPNILKVRYRIIPSNEPDEFMSLEQFAEKYPSFKPFMTFLNSKEFLELLNKLRENIIFKSVRMIFENRIHSTSLTQGIRYIVDNIFTDIKKFDTYTDGINKMMLANRILDFPYNSQSWLEYFENNSNIRETFIKKFNSLGLSDDERNLARSKVLNAISGSDVASKKNVKEFYSKLLDIDYDTLWMENYIDLLYATSTSKSSYSTGWFDFRKLPSEAISFDTMKEVENKLFKRITREDEMGFSIREMSLLIRRTKLRTPSFSRINIDNDILVKSSNFEILCAFILEAMIKETFKRGYEERDHVVSKILDTLKSTANLLYFPLHEKTKETFLKLIKESSNKKRLEELYSIKEPEIELQSMLNGSLIRRLKPENIKEHMRKQFSLLLEKDKRNGTDTVRTTFFSQLNQYIQALRKNHTTDDFEQFESAISEEILMNDDILQSIKNSSFRTIYYELIDRGLFDNIDTKTAHAIMPKLASGKLDFIFDKSKLKGDWGTYGVRKVMQRMADILQNIIFDNIDENPKLVDSYFDRINEVYYQNRIRNSLVGYEAIINEVSKGTIKPFDKIDSTRIKKMLKFNDVKVAEILKVRKKKNEPFSKYLKRAQEEVLKTHALKDLAVVEKNLDNIEKTRISVDLIEKHHAGKHGNVYCKVLNMFDVHLPEEEFQEFRKLMMNDDKAEKEPVKPAFHGTGGIAAGMILRYGFKVISAHDSSVVGRMLGDGIYFSNKIDKSLQYVGNQGSTITRRHGSKGYIFDMDNTLGVKNQDWCAAGLGSDSIRSPEWVVKDGRKQLKIIRAYEVELVSVDDYRKMKAKLLGEHTNKMSFKKFLKEEIQYTEIKNQTSFVFWDGEIPVYDEKKEDWKYIPFEKIDKNPELLPEGCFLDYSSNGPVIVFTDTIEQENFDIRYANSMNNKEYQSYTSLFFRYK